MTAHVDLTEELPISVVRSKRRTFQLTVKPDGEVVLRTPQRASVRKVEEFLRERRDWLEKARAKVLSRVRMAGPRGYFDGANFFVLGDRVTLKVERRQKGPFRFEEADEGWRAEVPSSWAEEHVAREVERVVDLWYHRKAREVLPERVAYWAETMKHEMPSLTIKAQKKRWGSCNRTLKTVNLNWRLVAFPMDIIDHVVVHELCHLCHPDHSVRFWEEMKRWRPYWKTERMWLKESAPWCAPI